MLAPILRAPVLGRAQIEASDSAASLHNDFDARLARVAMDSSAPPLIRSNAVLLLADRRVPKLPVYLAVLDAEDDRVRAAGVVALRPFLTQWPSAIGLVRVALNDSSTLVQAKALETLSDNYVDDLRAYVQRTRDRDLRKIAEDLIRTGEERGAPLVPADSTGLLRRTTLTGQQITYRPAKRWGNWGVTLGVLELAQPGKAAVRISDSVEVVRNVVPAFVSAEGSHLVYEANRTIHVRDLASGTDHVIGPGIAPRLIPFSEAFLYLRARPAGKIQIANAIEYDVVQSPFGGGAAQVIGLVTVEVKQDVHGRAAPVRWARVRESEWQLPADGRCHEAIQAARSVCGFEVNVARLLFPAIRWHAEHGFSEARPADRRGTRAGCGRLHHLRGRGQGRTRADRGAASAQPTPHPDRRGPRARCAGQQFTGATPLPPLAAIGSLADLDVTRRAGELTAREARALGVTWVYAPDADVDVEPRNPIIGTRSFGTRHANVARHVQCLDRRLSPGRRSGLRQTLSRPRTYNHRFTRRAAGGGRGSQHRDEAIWNRFGQPSSADVDSVMSAHISFPALDPAARQPRCLLAILTELLRRQLGFQRADCHGCVDHAGRAGRGSR